MHRYKIKAIYGNNSAIKGFVWATSKNDALRQAEERGLLDDCADADDFVAVLTS